MGMKMDQAQFYRARAHAERKLAEQTMLPQERSRHLQPAAVWDGMAEKIERTARLKIANDKARQKSPSATVQPRSRVSRVEPRP